MTTDFRFNGCTARIIRGDCNEVLATEPHRTMIAAVPDISDIGIAAAEYEAWLEEWVANLPTAVQICCAYAHNHRHGGCVLMPVVDQVNAFRKRWWTIAENKIVASAGDLIRRPEFGQITVFVRDGYHEYIRPQMERGSGMQFRRDYWHFDEPAVLPPSKQTGGFNNAFCLPFARMMVKGLTQPGETVLIPFLGSGTVAIAALLEGRNAIGTEINADTFEIAVNRLKELCGGLV